jgi:hypothetical protein
MGDILYYTVTFNWRSFSTGFGMLRGGPCGLHLGWIKREREVYMESIHLRATLRCDRACQCARQTTCYLSLRASTLLKNTLIFTTKHHRSHCMLLTAANQSLLWQMWRQTCRFWFAMPQLYTVGTLSVGLFIIISNMILPCVCLLLHSNFPKFTQLPCTIKQ